MANWTNNNPTYYINPAHLTFVENSGYGPNFIQVSASSSCYISVYDPANGINFSDADKNYCRWKVTAYNNKFPDTESAHRGKWGIYVRCERQGSSALVVYDQVERGVHGGVIVEKTDEQGNVTKVEGEYDKENHPYYFIRIGEVGPTNGTTIREISYDTGYLESKQGEQDSNSINDMWELDKYSTPWLIKAKQWLKDFTVKGFITLMGGLKFSKGKEGDEKVITDVKRSTDSDMEFLKNEDGTDMKDEDGNFVPNPMYVPINDETIPTTKWVEQQASDRYLKKYEPDETDHQIKFHGGIEVGTFVKGDLAVMGGSGTQFDADGYGEMNGLTLREFLQVPELRFNRIDVVNGILWNSVAFGLIETVDETKCICTLKLEEGERGGLQVDDICMGMFCDFGTGTKEEGFDDNNLPKMYGFSTSYFTPTEILNDEEGFFKFKYSLQPGKKFHPKPSMKFAVYGNFTVKSRQTSAYSTRSFQRYLNNVAEWKVDPDKHVYAQYGNLDDLTVGGVKMEGYSAFMKNVYLTGGFFEITPEQKEDLKGEDAYAVFLSDYIGTIRVNEKGEVIGGEYSEMNVTTGDENVVTGGENVITTDILLRTQIQAFRGKTELVYSDSIGEGKYKASIHPVGCVATLSNGVISVAEVKNVEYSYIRIGVSCEGYASFELTYQIKVANDGRSSFECSVFTRSVEEPAIPVGGSYDAPMPNKVNGVEVWHDGVPEGDYQLWMSRRTYSTDGEWPQTNWSVPRPLTDTADFEAIYCPLEEYPAIPDWFKKIGTEIDSDWLALANEADWYDEPADWKNTDKDYKDKPAFWMATNTCKNGVWQGWVFVRVLGEKGDSPLVLQASAKTVSRNAFGTFQPETLLVRAVRGDEEETTNIALFLIKDGESISADGASWQVKQNVSQWTLDLKGYKEDFDTMYFRCYAERKAWYSFDVNVDPPIYTEAVNFIGDGHSGPMPRNRGKYDENTAYFYNEDYRDFVWTDDGEVYMREGFGDAYEKNQAATDIDGTPRNGAVIGQPLTSEYWKRTSRQTLTAIDTALVENANIAGFMFKGGRMVSQDMAVNTKPLPDAKLILDGTTGFFKCVDAEVDGDISSGSMFYKVKTGGGSLEGYTMAYGSGNFDLPLVDSSKAVTLKAYCPAISKSDYLYPLKIKATGNSAILIYDPKLGYSRYVTEAELEFNKVYTMIGVGLAVTGDVIAGSSVSTWFVGTSVGGSGADIIVDETVIEGSIRPVAGGAVYAEFEKMREEIGNKVKYTPVWPPDGGIEEDVLYIL